MNKDYYLVLGIFRRHVSLDDIRQAFRKRAFHFHPDRNRRPDAEEKFKEINEAHQVLTDPDKRRQYDKLPMTLLVLNEQQGVPADLYGNAHFGEGNFAIRVCRDYSDVDEMLRTEKARFLHFK